MTNSSNIDRRKILVKNEFSRRKVLIHKWRDMPRSQQYFFVYLLAILLRAVFSLNVGLIDDEAYHWSWAQRPMLSYFDHPGMIAWLNYVSTGLFGDTLLGVRLPSFLCYAFTILVSFFLARDLFDERAGVFTALMLLFTPFWGFGGYVASPEPPFMFCWVLAAWIFWKGTKPDRAWSLPKTWICLGVVMGLGLNSKFIMSLLAPGFGFYLLLTPDRRRDLTKSWPWIGFLIATLLCLPIFLWNIEFDWPGFRYQFHDRHVGEDFSVLRWLGWWAAQWVFMTPLLYPLLLAAFVVAYRRIQQPSWRFIFCLALPSILVFYPQPLWAEYKPHWSGAAYLILCFGAGALWSQGLEYRHRWLIFPQSERIKKAFMYFLIPLNVIVYSPFIATSWPRVFHFFKPTGAWNPRWDLSNEFAGWTELGDFVNRRQREIHAQTGRRPFIAALRYETTAQTYWGSKQKTYMLSYTRSHYTMLHQHDHEWEQLFGGDALVVTTEKYQAEPIEWGRFDSCTPEVLKTYRDGELSREFTVWYCKNFRGILK